MVLSEDVFKMSFCISLLFNLFLKASISVTVFNILYIDLMFNNSELKVFPSFSILNNEYIYIKIFSIVLIIS